MSCRVQITGDAIKAATFEPWARKQWANMESGRKTWHFDGVTIEVIRSGESGVVRIKAEGGIGVLLHPRQGAVKLFTHYSWESTPVGIVAVPEKTLHGVAGGWTNGVTPLAGEYIYPLIDADDASYLLGSESADDDEITGDFADSTGNYGNLYWRNEDADNPVFLSWKGTPARHFRLGSNIEIDGFSTQETSIPGAIDDLPLFTSFGTKIYQSGNVLVEAPRWNWPYSGQDRCLVLGVTQDTDGVLWAVMQSDRYNVPNYIVYFSDGYRMATDDDGAAAGYLSSHSGVTIVFEKHYPTKLGIYTMLWKQGGPVDGWAFVQEWNTGREGIPWFGNKAGTEFVSSTGDRITVGGDWFNASTGSGIYAETKTGADGESIFLHGRFAATFSAHDFYEFALDALVSGSRSLSFSATTDKTYVEPALKAYTGSFRRIYNPDDPAQAPRPLRFQTSTSDTQQVVVGAQFYALVVDGQGTRTFTYNGFTVNDIGVVTSATGCGMGSVTVTDECGDSDTKEVRLPSGVWLDTGNTFWLYGYPYLPQYYNTSIFISGSSKEVWVTTTECQFEQWVDEPYLYPDYTAASAPPSNNPVYPNFTSESCTRTAYPSGVARNYTGHTYVLVYAIYRYTWVCP